MIQILKYPKLSIFAAVLFCLPVSILAQHMRPPAPQDVRAGQQGEPKPDLMLELGLSREQIQSIRRLNADRKPVEQEARRRFQDANRELNMAIYSDTTNDENVQVRLKEFQTAQAELARIKFSNELAVRKLLTPDQLIRFRELRRRFAEVRQNIEKRRGGPNGQPGLRRMRRGNQPPLVN